MLVDTDLNPRVREILKTALLTVTPIWVALCQEDREVTQRLAVYVELADSGWYVNINQLDWHIDDHAIINHASISHAKAAPAIYLGVLLKTQNVRPKDIVRVLPGRLEVGRDLLP